MVLVDWSHYNTITSISFSPCGEYFVCGNVYGDLVIYNLNSLISNFDSIDENVSKITKNKFTVRTDKNTRIHSITSSDQFIIIGLTGEIIGWKWQDIIESASEKLPNSAWNIIIPADKRNLDVIPEVNSLKVGSKLDTPGDTLFIGCGDNNIYSYSLEDGRLLATYSSHTDYVHNIDHKDNTLVSCSEDGSVRMWDVRTSTIINCIEPFKHKELIRPCLGNWIGDVSISEDWMVCGGGTRLSLWNLRTVDCPMTVFNETHDEGIHVAQFNQDCILAGGSAPCLSILNFNDELRTGIQTSSNTIYSCAVTAEHNPVKALGIVGNSNNVDVSTNFSYRECVVPFY